MNVRIPEYCRGGKRFVFHIPRSLINYSTNALVKLWPQPASTRLNHRWAPVHPMNAPSDPVGYCTQLCMLLQLKTAVLILKPGSSSRDSTAFQDAARCGPGYDRMTRSIFSFCKIKRHHLFFNIPDTGCIIQYGVESVLSSPDHV